jgi:mRNA-degrading endonuclease YafQ of YafQ-DinJ toxin-antitoxin module
MQLVWTTTFSRAFKQLVRQKPQLRPQIEQILEQLLADPFHPSLKTHKLRGALAGRWS